MSSRYDYADTGEQPPPRPPLEPVPTNRAKLVGTIVVVALTALVGIGAAFGADFCPYVRAVGISLDSCAPPAAPAPPAPTP